MENSGLHQEGVNHADLFLQISSVLVLLVLSGGHGFYGHTVWAPATNLHTVQSQIPNALALHVTGSPNLFLGFHHKVVLSLKAAPVFAGKLYFILDDPKTSLVAIRVACLRKKGGTAPARSPAKPCAKALGHGAS